MPIIEGILEERKQNKEEREKIYKQIHRVIEEEKESMCKYFGKENVEIKEGGTMLTITKEEKKTYSLSFYRQKERVIEVEEKLFNIPNTVCNIVDYFYIGEQEKNVKERAIKVLKDFLNKLV